MSETTLEEIFGSRLNQPYILLDYGFYRTLRAIWIDGPLEAFMLAYPDVVSQYTEFIVHPWGSGGKILAGTFPPGTPIGYATCDDTGTWTIHLALGEPTEGQ